MVNKHQKISKATMSRFPRYLKALRNMQHEGKEHFLSSELSEATGILDTTIRRDFGFLTDKESLGKRGIGYDTKEIINILNNVLGLGLDESIILIGVGNLGSAILKYNRWQYTVGKIVCCYDQDQNKVGERFDRLMALGVKGIVDFTHSHFTVHDDVVVQTVDVVVAIQELVLKMHANDE